MNVRICDLCSERYNLYQLKLTHRPNDEDLCVELCSQCLRDIQALIKKLEQKV